MSTTESSGCEDEVLVIVTSNAQEQRHQQQRIVVSDDVASENVNTTQHSNSRSRAQAKMSEAGQERLERQRFNKRKWAQKERARSKALMDTLKLKNGNLEFENQKLRGEVDELMQKSLDMRSALLDHQCQKKAATSRMMNLIRLPPTHTRTQTEQGVEDVMEVDKDGDAYSSFARLSSGQLHHRLKDDGKKDNIRHSATTNRLPSAGTRCLVVKTHLVDQLVKGSGQGGQQTHSVQIVPGSHRLTSTSPKPGTRIVQQSDSQPHTSNKTYTQIKVESRTDVVELLPPASSTLVVDDVDNDDDSNRGGQTLTSGGFSLSDMTDSNRTFLQMLEDDQEDVEIKDMHVRPKTQAVQITGERSESRQRLPNSGLAAGRTAAGATQISESRVEMVTQSATFKQDVTRAEPDLMMVSPPPVIRQSVARSVSDSQNRSKASPESPAAVVASSTSNSHKVTVWQRVFNITPPDRNTPDSDRQLESVHTPASEVPRVMDVTVPKSAKQMTRKSVLMDRWFAQEQTKKKQVVPQKTDNNTRQTNVNPWAVVESLKRQQNSVFRSSSDSVALDLSKTSARVRGYPRTPVSTNIAVSKPQDMTFIPPSTATRGSDRKVLVNGTPEISVKASVSSLAGYQQSLTTSQADVRSALEAASDVCAMDTETDTATTAIVFFDGHSLTRRHSWPRHVAGGNGGAENCRERCPSLPSSFSDVPFMTAEGSDQAYVYPEELSSDDVMMERNGTDYVTTFSNDATLQAIEPMRFTAETFRAQTAEPNVRVGNPALATDVGMTPRKPSPHFSLDYRPSTPSSPYSPPPSYLFGNSVMTVSVDRQDRQAMHVKYDGRVKEETEGGRVKVERVPDADITWQVVCEIPRLSGQTEPIYY